MWPGNEAMKELMKITNHMNIQYSRKLPITKWGQNGTGGLRLLYELLPWQPTLQPTDDRIYILYTLYNLPEVYLLASLVNFFDNHREYVR